MARFSRARAIRQRTWLAIGVILSVLLCDQVIKVAVKTNMCLHEARQVTEWFYIYFTENQGMAFGMDFIGTMALSIFRIIAVSAFAWLLVKVIRGRYPVGLVVCMSLIVSGAAGNIFDNCFYGLIFDASTPTEVAHFVPFGYFPLIDASWPQWVPMVGGEHFVFFSAVFNFADAAISCGAVALLFFYHRYIQS